jgi:ABC-type sugar transport system substrate-binding protein
VFKKVLATVAIGVLATSLAACGNSDTGTNTPAANKQLVLGFAQVGAESGWRTANTKSIQDAAAAAGIDLKFADAQQKQENQIKAIRSYIAQKVDVIAFSPVVETGWDAVLQEAKRAKIPVILTDRAVKVSDPSLYKTFLGSDFVHEGQEVGDWLVKNASTADVNHDGTVNVVQIEGTTGSAPAIDRKTGFEKAIQADSKIKVIASQTGDFTRDGGKQVMETFLHTQKNIDVLFAHNDDEALGAIQAIKAAGLTPGKDIKIMSIDATHDGMAELAKGEISYIAECNPLLGPQLMDLAKKVVKGESVPTRVVTKETTFTPEEAAKVLPSRKY